MYEFITLGFYHIFDIIVEVNFVDFYDILPGEVLQDSCDECLGKEEAWEPESLRGSLIDPTVEECDSVDEVLSPTA